MKSYFAGVLLLTLLSGCAASGPAASSKPGKTDGNTIFNIPPDPVQVSVSLDDTRRAEQVIGTQGGRIDATGADGTAFALEIPAQAVVSDTNIVMTPVKSIDGMPFGDGNNYAIQLEPEGLHFFGTAILTIKPTVELPLDQQLMFGYQESGTNLVLASPVVDSKEIKIQIDHFSGYGVTKGFLADIEPVRQRIGGNAETRLQSRIAEQLSRERQRQLLGGEANGDTIDFEGYFKDYEEQVVKPRIAAAGESCAAGRSAIQTVLGFERQKQLLGMADSEDGTAFDSGLMETVANTCMKEEYEICRDEHVITNIIPSWLGLERQFQLLGMAENSSALTTARQYVSKCMRFELQLHSEGHFDDGGGGGYDSTVESKAILQFNPDDLTLRGEAPLVNLSFEFKVPSCNVTSQRGGGTFTAVSLAYELNNTAAVGSNSSIRDFTLVYFPGNSSESATVACEDNPPYTFPSSPLWTGMFLVLHESEMDQQAGGFVAKGWDMQSGDYLAKKEWILEDGLGITEVGTFKLYHRPQ